MPQVGESVYPPQTSEYMPKTPTNSRADVMGRQGALQVNLSLSLSLSLSLNCFFCCSPHLFRPPPSLLHLRLLANDEQNAALQAETSRRARGQSNQARS